MCLTFFFNQEKKIINFSSLVKFINYLLQKREFYKLNKSTCDVVMLLQP